MSEVGHREIEDEIVATRLREELARRRISRQAAADMARISLSTLEKALSGSRPFTLATVIRLEDVLETPLRARQQMLASSGPAPEHMGSYSRQAVRWIEGSYVTLRPSFGIPGAIYSYRTEIAWDDAAGHLGFAESDRIDAAFAQSGFVSMPNLSGHTYLMTSEAGQYRMIVLGRATRDRRMFGLLTTLQVGAGTQLIPTACAIAMVPQDQLAEPVFGLIEAGDPVETEYRKILERAIDNDFCRWQR